MASPTQRARRTWFLAWLPLFPLVYVLLNAAPFFKAIYVEFGIGDALPIPTMLTLDVSDLLIRGWGLPGLLASLVLPYGTWMCVRDRGRLRSWAAGCVFVTLLALLGMAQMGMWLPLYGGMLVLEDGEARCRSPGGRFIRWVVLETWKPHGGRPPAQEDFDRLNEASAPR